MADAAPGRRVDAFGVVLSLLFLTVASVGLAGDPWWFLHSAVKWVIAGAIAMIGLGLLLGAVPRQAGHRQR